MKSTFLSPEEQVAFMKTFRSASAARRSGQVLYGTCVNEHRRDG